MRLVWLFAAIFCVSVPAVELDCLGPKGPAASLPRRLGVGVANVVDNPARRITIFVPLPTEKTKGRVQDLHEIKKQLPDRFVLGDGSIFRNFVGVDNRANSRLSQCLSEIATKMKNDFGPKSNNDWYETLRAHVADYLAPVHDDEILPWDEDLPPTPDELNDLVLEARRIGVQDPPLISEQTHSVIPFENYLREGKGYCLQKTLLTGLILKHLGLPYRIKAGGTELVGSGHNWIELPDGRMLDTTWQLLEKPTTQGALPGWFHFGMSFLFANERFPYLVLDEGKSE